MKSNFAIRKILEMKWSDGIDLGTIYTLIMLSDDISFRRGGTRSEFDYSLTPSLVCKLLNMAAKLCKAGSVCCCEEANFSLRVRF